MRNFYSDRPEVEALLFEINHQTEVGYGLYMVDFLHHRGRVETVEILRDYYPSATEEEIRRKLADVLCGEELAVRVFGPLPEAVKGPIPLNPLHSGRYASPEDFIICFLTLYQRGNASQSQYWQNILRLIQAQGDELDIVLLMHWAAEFEFSDLLERSLSEAEG